MQLPHTSPFSESNRSTSQQLSRSNENSESVTSSSRSSATTLFQDLHELFRNVNSIEIGKTVFPSQVKSTVQRKRKKE